MRSSRLRGRLVALLSFASILPAAVTAQPADRPGSDGQFSDRRGAATDDAGVYVLDQGIYRIREFGGVTTPSELIIFAFTGHVIQTNKPAVFPLDQTIVGQYTFESTTPGESSGGGEQGAYFGALTSFSFTSGSYAVLADESNSANGGGDIIVNRNSFFDPHQYQVFLIRGTEQVPLWGPNVGDEQLVRMWLRLIDANLTAITSVDLPLTPPDLEDFTSNTFGLIYEFDPTGDPGVVFGLDTLTSATVGPSEIGFEFVPKTLNLTSRGRWVTGFLEPALPLDASDIDISSIRLNGTVAVDLSAPTALGDHDGNGVSDLMVKFSLAAVGLTLSEGDNVPVNVTGTLGSQSFSGTDHIHVTGGAQHRLQRLSRPDGPTRLQAEL